MVEAVSAHEVFSFTLFGQKIIVTDTIVVMWVIMAVIILLVWLGTKNFKKIPKGPQNLVEMFVDFINKLCRDTIGHHGMHFAPYLGTILLFLAVSNTISIFDIIPSSDQLFKLTHLEFFKNIPAVSLRPPTRDVNVTAAMAIMSIILVLGAGIRFKKMGGWLKSFVEPMPIILPFKIMDYFIRPLSLCFRLFGNILGAFIIMEFLYSAIPILFPAALSMYFDIFDGILQAYIFVFLTTLYITEAIE